MYTSSDDNDDGYYDNYISRALLCGTGPVYHQHLTTQDAAIMCLLPNPKSHERGCWICPLGCLHVPAAHPQKEEFQEALLTFANKGSHPIYVNLVFFELSPNKIHALKSIKTTENLTEYLIHLLHNISINLLPHEVEMFVRNCDPTKYRYDQCTLIGSSDCPTYSKGNRTDNLDNLDFFTELSLTPEDWKGWHASRQKQLDELIADDDYDPLDPHWRRLESRLRTGLLKNYVKYTDYDPFDAPVRFVASPPSQKHVGQDFTIQNAVNDGLSPKYKSEGHCWIWPAGCIHVPLDHPHRELIHNKLLIFANRVTQPTRINFFELSPIKIHAIKALNPPAELIPDLVAEIIHILDTLSMNHLPCEVKMFVENCDITAQEYNQCTLSGAPDSMQGFKESRFYNFLNYLDRDEEWRGWIARQERFPNNHDEEDGCDDDVSISVSLYRQWEECNDYDSDSSDALPATDFDNEYDDDDSDDDNGTPAHQHANEMQRLLDKLTAKDYSGLSDPSQQQWLVSMLRKGLNAYAEDNDYDPHSVFDPPQQPCKQKAPPITYDDDDPFVASPWTQQHANHHHTTCRPWHPPKFISCPNGTLFRVLSNNDSKNILDTSRTDLENILLSQGQFCSRRLLQMSTVFTHDAREQALLQGPKSLEFVNTLHRLYCLLRGVLIQSNHIVSPEVVIENRYTYKQQEDFLCFDGDFDNDDDEEAGSNVSIPPSILPTTIPTTAAADLLLSLINQVPATSSPPSPTSLSQFNFSYTDVTPPTTPGPSADSNIVPSKPIPCDKYGASTLPTTSWERTTSYSLLSSHLLIPSQFIKLSYGDDHYCTVSAHKQRPATVPSSSSSNTSTVPETLTPPLHDTPSRSVSSDDVSNNLSSFSSAVDVGLTMILTMMILPTILIIFLIILPMMVLMLPAVIGTHEEQYVFSDDDMTTNTVHVRPTSVPKAISIASPSSTSTHASGKRKELRLQRQQFWAFIQKLQYSRIGSSCSGFQWITAILYKLSMTIWTLWQFHNDGICSSSSAWQLVLGVLH